MPSTAAELTVTVKLFAVLRDQAPAGADPRGFLVHLPPGATVAELAARLDLPAEAWRVAFRNHRRSAADAPLEDGDTVAFVPPIAGG